MDIKIEINGKRTINTNSRVNRHGYMKNSYMRQDQIEEMKLQYGANKIKYMLGDYGI